MDILERNMRGKKPTTRFQIHRDATSSTSIRHQTRFRCNICSKRFSSKHCLIEHTYKHTNLKPITCTVCQMQFRHASQFTLHKKKHEISQLFRWPRMVELDMIDSSDFERVSNESQKIDLPLISEPKIQLLPLFKEALENTFKKLFS